MFITKKMPTPAEAQHYERQASKREMSGLGTQVQVSNLGVHSQCNLGKLSNSECCSKFSNVQGFALAMLNQQHDRFIKHDK